MVSCRKSKATVVAAAGETISPNATIADVLLIQKPLVDIKTSVRKSSVKSAKCSTQPIKEWLMVNKLKWHAVAKPLTSS